MSDTIDITNLIETMKDTWVRWAVQAVVTVAKGVPWLSWLASPVFSYLFSALVTAIVKVIANGVEMESFFLNTALRKASQAKDYVNASNALKALPPTVSDAEYEKYEQIEMSTFRSFVSVTR